MIEKKCECCGNVIQRINVRTSKYCEACSKEVKRAKTRERVRRLRERNKASKFFTEEVHNL